MFLGVPIFQKHQIGFFLFVLLFEIGIYVVKADLKQAE